MSMKRSKPVTRRSRSSADSKLGAKKAEAKFDWDEHVANAPDAHFVTYSLNSKFERSQLIEHSKFGRGIVTNVDGARIEVLFQEGTKKLSHVA